MAANDDDSYTEVPSGAISPTQEEYEAYLDSLTEEDWQKIREKEAAVEELANRPQPRIRYKISIPGSFTMYQQEKDMYCVPACAKSMVQYLKGSSDSQDTIAKAMGTTTNGTARSKIAPYLNSQQSKEYYVYVSEPTPTAIRDNLYHIIVTKKAPASISIAGTTTSDWYYTTGGHHLVVNAIYSDKSIIQVADPLGGKVGNTPYYYEKSAATVTKYCQAMNY